MVVPWWSSSRTQCFHHCENEALVQFLLWRLKSHIKHLHATGENKQKQKNLWGVPTVVHWVKNLTAAAQVTAEVWIPSSARPSGLRIQRCYNCVIGCSCGLDLIPDLGTSICQGYGH